MKGNKGWSTSNPRSIRPLTTDQERTVESWLAASTLRGDEEGHRARFVAAFYYTGIHPSCLGRRSEYQVSVSGEWLDWVRAKTRTLMRFPLPPQVSPWMKTWLDGLPEYDPKSLLAIVHSAGRHHLGMPWLTPRCLRHDAIARGVDKFGVSVARTLFGASPEIVLRYASRSEAKSASDRIRKEGF